MCYPTVFFFFLLNCAFLDCVKLPPIDWFSKLRDHGGLSAEVQRKLRACNVAEGVVRRDAWTAND
jgi:hypothetical protein